MPDALATELRRVPLIKPDLPTMEEVQDQFREILESGKITNFSKYVSAFEADAGAYIGTNVVTVSSGTMALLLTLQALGIKPGARVIMPSFTFMATAQAVLYAGGVPVFAEIQDDLTISPGDLELLLARYSDVAAVIPVHMYGLPCRVDDIQRVVDSAASRQSRSIALVYDSAHAFGSSLADGRRVGGFGTAEVFSLSVTKLLVTVEGGMIASGNEALVQRLRKMRNYGIESNYDAHSPGLNGKMSEFHAIIGLRNLARLPERLAERQRLSRIYASRIELRTPFRTLPVPEGVTHTFKDFTIVLPVEWTQRRGRIISFLADRGIETRAYFSPPLHEQAFFRRFADRPLPVTEDLSRRVITLPFYSSISEEEIDYVVDGLVSAHNQLSA
jgi:dTDP-4-amino-4,6-dideoxygalactose transaminase